jgi:hypothetical protein
MKTYLIDIPEKSESLFLKLFRKFHIKNRALDKDEYEKRLMHALIKESDNSENLSEEEIKKFFAKHGVEL